MIDGIDRTDEREHREKAPGHRAQHFGLEKRQPRDVEVAVEDHDRNGQHLADELGPMTELAGVVPNAEREKYRDPDHVRLQGRFEVERQQERRHRADGDAPAADPRHRRSVHFAQVREIEQPKTRRRPHQQRNDEHAHGRRERQKQERIDAFHCHPHIERAQPGFGSESSARRAASLPGNGCVEEMARSSSARACSGSPLASSAMPRW